MLEKPEYKYTLYIKSSTLNGSIAFRQLLANTQEELINKLITEFDLPIAHAKDIVKIKNLTERIRKISDMHRQSENGYRRLEVQNIELRAKNQKTNCNHIQDNLWDGWVAGYDSTGCFGYGTVDVHVRNTACGTYVIHPGYGCSEADVFNRSVPIGYMCNFNGKNIGASITLSGAKEFCEGHNIGLSISMPSYLSYSS